MNKMFCNKSTKNFNNKYLSFIEKRPAIFITGAIVLTIMILSIGIISANVSADMVPPREKMVTSIKIEKGDTLWSIANEYITEDYKDINSYINEIKKSNGLIDDTIHEGKYLIIPYYSLKEVANNSW